MVKRRPSELTIDTHGRVFASHWHNYWFERGPAPWPAIANFDHQEDLPIPFTATMLSTVDASHNPHITAPEELLEWVDYLDRRCPECEGEAK